MKIGKYLSGAALPKQERINDGKCSANGCPLPGSICHSTGGPSTGQEDNREWLCRFHFGVSSRNEWPAITEKILRGEIDTKVSSSSTNTAILKSVDVRGTLKWAHEVRTLFDAGMYPSYHGYKMACDALNVDPKQPQEVTW